jgi:threonine/homoserine/homoserine lactone efflux protein
MSLYGLGLFMAVYALAVATPGPGVAAILARSLSRGLAGAPAFIAGFLIGDFIWFGTAALGLAAIAKTAATLFLIIKYAGAAYLLFLAYKLWTTEATPMETRVPTSAEKPFRLFLSSLALTLGNPKTIIFFLALLPTVVDLQNLKLTGYLEIAAVILVVLPTVLGAYAVAAARARQLFKSSRALKIMNRGTGAAMAGAAIAVATR